MPHFDFVADANLFPWPVYRLGEDVKYRMYVVHDKSRKAVHAAQLLLSMAFVAACVTPLRWLQKVWQHIFWWVSPSGWIGVIEKCSRITYARETGQHRR